MTLKTMTRTKKIPKQKQNEERGTLRTLKHCFSACDARWGGRSKRHEIVRVVLRVCKELLKIIAFKIRMSKENLSRGKASVPQDKAKVSMSVDCDE